MLERLRGQFAKLLSRKRHVGPNPTASSMNTEFYCENDDIDDGEDMWIGRNSEDDERNIELFIETDHIKLI